MKLVSFKHQGQPGYGVLKDGGIVDGRHLMGEGYPSLQAVIGAGKLDELAGLAENAAADFQLADVELTIPITNPEKIFAVGRNYGQYHEIEAGNKPPYPSIFIRVLSGFVAPGAPIIRPRASEQLDYEGELAVIIGRRGRHIAEGDALSYIAGYTILNEGSVRDWQQKGTQNTPGKNFYHSGSIGPCMITADEIPDPTKLRVVTRVNGEERQNSTTDLMFYTIPYVISHISTFTWLEPGDIISTGSPGGTGISFDPPRWLAAGDVVEVEISEIGLLQNPVEDE